MSCLPWILKSETKNIVYLDPLRSEEASESNILTRVEDSSTTTAFSRGCYRLGAVAKIPGFRIRGLDYLGDPRLSGCMVST